MSIIEQMQQELQELKESSNLRILPDLIHEGRDVIANGQRMLNLSSNDYLGLATDRTLREEFLKELTADSFLPTSSSSRLLTGNFTIYEELEQTLAELFGTEAALVFNSGYHANTGILPAVSDAQTLILADKLVHASLIDGIRLSTAKCIRYRHNDLKQLERLLAENHAVYRQVIIVTESIFSMDGDIADLKELVRLKRMYENVLLYVDEAHAFGARGEQGLGCAEEAGCIREIDFLVGTFGKAAASDGAYIVCRRTIREYLPFLSDALSDDPHITTPILAALRKGKSHYVCDERLRQHLQQRPANKNPTQKHELCSLYGIFDLDETQKLSSFDRERVCVPQFCDCKHPDCRYRRHLTECGQKRYLFQICNQNLWLADCMHRESGLKPILPDACTVIVDEAHKLPETAREMFGTTLVAREIHAPTKDGRAVSGVPC